VHIHMWDGADAEDRYRFFMKEEATHKTLLRGHGATIESCFAQIHAWAWAAGYGSIDEQGIKDVVLN